MSAVGATNALMGLTYDSLFGLGLARLEVVFRALQGRNQDHPAAGKTMSIRSSRKSQQELTGVHRGSQRRHEYPNVRMCGRP